jgi:hypothetical protein
VQTRPVSKLKRWRILEIVGLTSDETEKDVKDKKG